MTNTTTKKIKPLPTSKDSLGSHLAIISCLILAILLSSIQFTASVITNSLLLFATGLFQLTLTSFLLFFLLVFKRKASTNPKKIKLATHFISSSVLLLLVGYIFYEIYMRLFEPTLITSSQALIVTLVILGGNLLMTKILSTTNLLRLRFQQFKWPFQYSSYFLVIAFTILGIIYLTDLFILDTIISFMVGISIFIWAGFTMMDAYWNISDLNY